ncbi:unnamed protein product, partial [Choristocarpus tenellus]
ISTEILLDVNDMFNLPYGVGDKMKEVSDLLPRARVNDAKEHFIPPVTRPKVPARHYFVFGRPIETSGVEAQDRKGCEDLYQQARSSVEAGIQYLLAARDHDPYASAPRRYLYESVMGVQV